MKWIKRISTIILLSIVGAFISSCTYKNDMLKTLKEVMHFYKSDMVIPDTLICINKGVVETMDLSIKQCPILIRYYGPTECKECAFNKMAENITLNTNAVANNVFFFIVMTPSKEEKETLMKKVKTLNVPLPIYVDTSLVFESMNIIPKDKRFHTFMIENQTPIYIGSQYVDISKEIQ